ncbi:MAG: AraC family transcriptional regulator [Balneolales bacterium]|nr:AraC family transcriptional regulator [Balneolales bacterium]
MPAIAVSNITGTTEILNLQAANGKTMADRVLHAEKLLFENPDSAIVTLEPIILELKVLPNDSLSARALYVMGTAYFFKDYYNLAVENYEKALETSYSKSNDAFRSRVLNNIGVSHDLLRHHDEALLYYFESLELEKRKGDPTEIADVYNNISLVYYAIGNYDEALQVLDLAVELIRNEPVTPLNGLILQNRGMIYHAFGDYDASTRATEKAIHIFEEFGYHRNKLQSILNIAIDLIDRNENLDRAKTLIEGAIDEAVKHDIPFQRAMMNIQLARIALLENRPASALTYLESARSIFDSLDDPFASFPLNIFKLSVEAYAKLGNVGGVTRSMEEYISKAEERDLANRARAVNELKVQLSYNENVARIQEQTIQLERQRARVTLFLSLFVVIVLLLAGLIAGYVYREKKLRKLFYLNQQARKKVSFIGRFTYANIEHSQNRTVDSKFRIPDTVLAYSSADFEDESISSNDVPESAADSKNNDSENKDGSHSVIFNQLQDLLEQEKVFLEQGLTLTDLSARLGVSGRAISAAIKHFSGSSFNHHINEYRVRHAMDLLDDQKKKHLSLDAIFLECGFSSKTTFYTAFDRLTGMTPSQYRKMSQKEKLS